MAAPFVYDDAMSGVMFLAYAEQVLVLTLKSGNTVIIVNLPAHKITGVCHSNDVADASLLDLPTYNPDFSWIETPSRSSGR